MTNETEPTWAVDFEGGYDSESSEERDRAVLAVELWLCDPVANRTRIALIRGVRRGLGGEAPEVAVVDYSEMLVAIERYGLRAALEIGAISPEQLGRLCWDAAGLREAHLRLGGLTALGWAEADRLENDPLVPPSSLLPRKNLAMLRDRATAAVENRLITLEDRLEFLLGFARAFREIRRRCAKVTEKSGPDGNAKVVANRLLKQLAAQERLMAEYGLDADQFTVTEWFRLSDDAAMETGEIAALYNKKPKQIEKALHHFRATVEKLQEAAPSSPETPQ